MPSERPIELRGDRWVAYNADDARAYAAALTTAGINYECHCVIVPESEANPTIEQWTFVRIKENA